MLGVEAYSAGGSADLVEQATLKGVAATEDGALLLGFDVAAGVFMDAFGEIGRFCGAETVRFVSGVRC